ncbi:MULTISPECIES: thioredoxin family protein [unclassified Roseovarius]|uniref:DUF1223 domain-containing protein n=1 Tax=unclassified Roseovarius TaxID=2614913 RepID=UPI00273E1744|nr:MULTISPECIES: DUF1223 domain-containing protein [unclassified Roseovarius]
MRKIATLLAAAFLLASPAQADDTPVVVELFTSQGCSSCPPADAFLHKLADREDVIALAMHVDYWDYIGWKDIFASAENTKRQRAYARAGGRKMIYTPQMIINGREHVVGNRPRDVVDLINKHKSGAGDVDLDVARDGNTLRIDATAGNGQKNTLVVQLIRYKPKSTVDIKRGENAGRRLSYANVVTEFNVLREWDTRKPLSMTTKVEGDAPVVVLVQHKGVGPIAAVARVR